MKISKSYYIDIDIDILSLFEINSDINLISYIDHTICLNEISILKVVDIKSSKVIFEDKLNFFYDKILKFSNTSNSIIYFKNNKIQKYNFVEKYVILSQSLTNLQERSIFKLDNNLLELRE